MNRTIYVADKATWKRAKDFCKARNMSISRLIADALAWYLDRLGA